MTFRRRIECRAVLGKEVGEEEVGVEDACFLAPSQLTAMEGLTSRAHFW